MRLCKALTLLCVSVALLADVSASGAGIVHRYSFNTNANDLIGTAHGTLVNGAFITNGGVSLNVAAAGTAYVNLPNGIISSLTNFTIEVWTTAAARANWGRVFDFGNSTGGEDAQGNGITYAFLTTVAGGATNSTLRFALSTNAGGAENPIINGPIISNNQAYYYAVVYNPSSNFSGLYVNGALVASNTATTPLSILVDINNWLGRSQYNDPYYRGTIDEFRIWDTRLSASQIATNFTNGPNNLGPLPPVAANDSATVIKGGAVTINVLQNDTAFGAQLNTNSVVVTGPPTNGTAIVQVGGSIRYTPTNGAANADSFTYTVADTLGAVSAPAAVSITINPLPASLVHRYSFNGTANDLAGTAHGTTNGGAILNNTSVVLDGTNDFVNLPNGIISSLTNMTIEAWVTQTTGSVWARIFDFGNSTGGEDLQGNGLSYVFLTPVGGAGAVRFAYSTNGNPAETPVLDGPVISNNVAYHYAVVYSPTDNSSELYVNGALVANGTATRPLSALTDNNNWLGKSQYINDAYFKGSIDEFRIWNGRLGPAQIASDFTNGPNNLIVVPPVAVNDSATLAPGGAVLINVLQNDQGQGSPLNSNSVAIVSPPSNGTAQVQSGGQILYTHNGGPSTADSFTYRVSDTVGSQSQPATVLLSISNIPPGLVHRYNFTVDANDQAGSAHGTLMGGAVISNGSVVMDGANGFVNLPNGIISSLTNVTIEAWVTAATINAWARIFDFGNSTGGEDAQGNGITYIFLTTSAGGGPLRFAYSQSAGGGEFPILNGPTMNPGAPYYIAVVYNPSDSFSALYVNGAVVATNSATGALSALVDVNNWLGRSQYNDPYYRGSIDEFRIWNSALGPAQIALNYSNGPNSMVLLPPIAVADSMILNPGAKALIDVTQNDVAQGAPLNPATVTIVGSPSAGTAQVKPDGEVLYTHNGGPTTFDSFTYRVQDLGGLTSSVATVSITITNALRLPNTTITVPNTPPVTAYQVVDAYPGMVFTNPLALRTPPNNTNMLFVVERSGVISYLTNISSTNPTRQILLNIGNQLSYNAGGEGELGLLSMDFHPNFASNGYFYVSYTAPGGNPYRERVSRFTANPTTFGLVDTNTQQVLFDTTKRAPNHNGADLHFGNDGYLYVGMGDEGDQYNMRTNAQRLDLALWAGMLRLDVDKQPGNLEPSPPRPGIDVTLMIPTNGSGQAFYSVPNDNPFIGSTTNVDGTPINTTYLRTEFYAIGMRHLWRFSIDKPTSNIWIGIVGQDRIEEVNILKKGGNYGWPYFEGPSNNITQYGAAGHPGFTDPPPGFQRDGPLWWYLHNNIPSTDAMLNDAQFKGLDVNGSLFYRGTRMPSLTNAYLFGDFDTGGNIWALRQPTSNSVTVERLAGLPGISAFGADPLNGDPLLCNYLQNKIQRLVVADTTANAFPTKLSDTGIFADLATLSPNPGIVSYSPNIAFWSDYAIKTRWFTIPDLTNTVGFATDTNWTLPTGMKWIKHFDLELDRGNPATKRRIETRVLVKTTNGVYGVSYKWNTNQDEAFLVADGGDSFQLTVTNAGVPFQQEWEIPSRSSCLSCHTAVGGQALTFNTREMNKTSTMNGLNGNQISLMSSGGYFSAPVPNPNNLPAFAVATDTNYSLEYRVRSYLAVNCVQCHQPGGAGQGNWDARAFLTLAQTGLINGTPVANDGGNPLNKLIVPGDTNHSVLLMRLENTNGFGRMPPLATHQLDFGSIQLVQDWITQQLPTQLSYSQWVAQYPSLVGSATNTTADPDGDGANNYFEYLTGTSPTNSASKWTLSVAVAGGQASVSYPQVPNLGVVLEVSSDLQNWTPWNVAGNQPFFASYPGTRTLSGPVLPLPFQFFRARLIQP